MVLVGFDNFPNCFMNILILKKLHIFSHKMEYKKFIHRRSDEKINAEHDCKIIIRASFQII